MKSCWSLEIIFLLFVVQVLLQGCAHSHAKQLAGRYTNSTYQTLPVQKQEPAIQVILTRSPFFYSHAAIRLVHADQVLFWDPAGSYGDTDERAEYFEIVKLPLNFHRIENLIVTGAPNLDEYWKFSIFTGDDAMEVFEWDLSEQQGKKYYDLLLDGTKSEGKKTPFITNEHYRICSSAVTVFLHDHAEFLSLNEQPFWPHDLSHSLHNSNADRIYLFELDQPIRIFKEH